MQDADPLDREIRALVRALVDSAPPAPPVPSSRDLNGRRRSRRRFLTILLPLSLLLAGGAAASITALVHTGPGVNRLFLRVASGGIAIRAYGTSSGVPEPQIEVGLSSHDAVGYMTGLAVTNPPGANWFYPVESTRFGVGASGGSATLVSVGPNIVTVRAIYSSGASDSMHPVSGWAVVATPGTEGTGRLIGLDGAGHRSPRPRYRRPRRAEKVSSASRPPRS